MAIVTFDDAPPARSGVVTFDGPPPQKIDTAAAGQKAVDEMTNNMSFGDKAVAGFGRAFVNLGLGAKQLIDGPAQYLESKLSNGTDARDSAMQTQQAIDQARVDDKALLHTEAGAIGDIASNMLLTAPAFIAAGPSAIGAGIASAGAAALEPVSGNESRLLNMAQGAALGYATQGVLNRSGDYIKGKMADMALKKSINAPMDKTIQSGIDAGFSIPQSNTNPGLFTNRVEGIAGKTAIAQEASNNNSVIFDALSRKEAGLMPNEPITSETLAARASKAYQEGYEPVKAIRNIPSDSIYDSALTDIVEPYFMHQQAFPNSDISPVVAKVSGYRNPDLTGTAAIDGMRELRAQANEAFANKNASMGQALRDVSDAIEGQIDRHLQNLAVANPGDENLSGILDNYRAAREQIAKIKTVDDALIEGGGTVDPRSYAKRIQAEKPMTGDLKVMGDFANNFDKSSQPYKKVAGYGVSKLDGVVSTGLGTLATQALGGVGGLAVGAGALMTPPLLRKVLLSGPVQRATVPRNYDPSMMQQFLTSKELEMGAAPAVNALSENYRSQR